MGHEMGHYVLNHVYKSILFFGVVLVVGFAFLRWAFDRAAAPAGASAGGSAASPIPPGCRCSRRCSRSTSSC